MEGIKKAKIVQKVQQAAESCRLFSTVHDNIIGAIAHDINMAGANNTIIVQSPFFSNNLIIQHLIQAAERGALVRVFTDRDSFNKFGAKLAANGVNLTFMENLHAKRIIIDSGTQKIMWVGSMNMSELSPENHELMVRCTDPKVLKGNQYSPYSQQSETVDFQSRQLVQSWSPGAHAAKIKVIEDFASCNHPHDYLYFVAYTLDDAEITNALIEAKQKTNNPITVLLDSKNWKNHALRFGYVQQLVLAGLDVYIFNKDEKQKRSDGRNKDMHIKAILRKCDQTCLSLISTANFTPKGRQGINFDLWEPCSLPFSERLKGILDGIKPESTKLDRNMFPSKKDLRSKETQLLEITKFPQDIYPNREKMFRLINEGADPNIIDQNGSNLLSKAFSADQDEIAQELIALGINVNYFTPDFQNTALQQAAGQGNIQRVQMLLDAGAEVNRADRRGNTPLFLAVSAGHNEVAQLLIAAGADVNLGGDYQEHGSRKKFTGIIPPIIQAVINKNPDPALVQTLLNAGADVDEKDREGLTAFLRACSDGNIELIKMLAHAHANVNAIYPRTGNTPLIAAISKPAPSSGFKGASTPDTRPLEIQTLLNVGADVDAKDNQGKTAIYYLEKRIREHSGNQEQLAFLKNTLELLKTHKFLRENPAAMEEPVAMESDMPQPQEERPLLIEAVLKNDLKFVDALIRAGEDVDATDNLGKNAIDYAQEAFQNADEKSQRDVAKKILELLRLHKYLKDHPGAME